MTDRPELILSTPGDGTPVCAFPIELLHAIGFARFNLYERLIVQYVCENTLGTVEYVGDKEIFHEGPCKCHVRLENMADSFKFSMDEPPGRAAHVKRLKWARRQLLKGRVLVRVGKRKVCLGGDIADWCKPDGVTPRIKPSWVAFARREGNRNA